MDLYNKNQVEKLNDKKILHKIGKHWVTISLATLMSLGLGALATTSVHADTDNQNQTTTLKQQINAHLHENMGGGSVFSA